ncbi:hypothetical protein [Thalassotalea maritima]|uniref:hypothetical protein n=1 Tax=Thalassotalea maritima TaxID=3242416 RepID=UPI003526C6C2
MLLIPLSLVCAVFFYCQAFKSGLGRKRWATAGLLLGPFAWPMFSMQQRMQMYKRYGMSYVTFSA